MRTYEAFILGAITGAAIVWFWRREIEDYARDKTRGVRTQAAEGLRAAEEGTRKVLDRGGDALRRAEEVLQELFLRLMRAARHAPSALENRAYVFRAARNEAYRALARRKRTAMPSSDHLLEVSDPRNGSEAERIAMQEALIRLPEEQREVIHLKVFMGMTFEEISDCTHVSPNTAASRYRYALEKLRDELGQKEERG